MIKQKIIELCSEDLSDAQFIKEVEKCLKEMHPYNHSLRSAQDACGININGVSIELTGKASEIIERIETKYTKREVAYILFDCIQKNSEKDPEEQYDALKNMMKKLRGN